jgi:predicted acetyltransferase
MRAQTSITARTCKTTDETIAAAACISHYFGFRPDQKWLDRWLNFFEIERMHAAFDGEAIIGGAGAFGLELTVPGNRSVPAAGVTVVGVLPTHRRRGALTALMRAQLDDLRRRGESLACLWASEETIYGRFGYGAAVTSMQMHLPRAHAQFRAPFEPIGRARVVSAEEALTILPPIYDAVRGRTPGMLSRSAGWWKHRRLLDLPERRWGAGPLEHMVLEVDGNAAAYALYRMRFSTEHFNNTGTVEVLEAFGMTPEATASIWRALLDIDWMASTKAEILPLDHPLRLLLVEPRRAGFRLYESLWLRLVDVRAALAARSFAASAIVLDVRDAFCDENQGRWSIRSEGRVERTDAEADLALDVGDLACVYLGGFTFRELSEAGRVKELRSGALCRADAMFRSNVVPFNAEVF